VLIRVSNNFTTNVRPSRVLQEEYTWRRSSKCCKSSGKKVIESVSACGVLKFWSYAKKVI
jgi:hypothetical protein